MKKIAIVGNIASGKSIAEGFLSEFYPVIDTDDISHRLFFKEDVKKELLHLFKGVDILDGEIVSREKIANLVFQNKEYLSKLENFIHPLIKNEIKNFFDKNSSSELVFVSVPLLFEAKFEKLFDKIIFIYADDSIRLKRLMNRNNLTEQEALDRMNSQIAQEKKLSLSDYVVKNETTKDDMFLQLKDIVDNLRD